MINQVFPNNMSEIKIIPIFNIGNQYSALFTRTDDGERLTLVGGKRQLICDGVYEPIQMTMQNVAREQFGIIFGIDWHVLTEGFNQPIVIVYVDYTTATNIVHQFPKIEIRQLGRVDYMPKARNGILAAFYHNFGGINAKVRALIQDFISFREDINHQRGIPQPRNILRRI
jgi:hypothetical protein